MSSESSSKAVITGPTKQAYTKAKKKLKDGLLPLQCRIFRLYADYQAFVAAPEPSIVGIYAPMTKGKDVPHGLVTVTHLGAIYSAELDGFINQAEVRTFVQGWAKKAVEVENKQQKQQSSPPSGPILPICAACKKNLTPVYDRKCNTCGNGMCLDCALASCRLSAVFKAECPSCHNFEVLEVSEEILADKSPVTAVALRDFCARFGVLPIKVNRVVFNALSEIRQVQDILGSGFFTDHQKQSLAKAFENPKPGFRNWITAGLTSDLIHEREFLSFVIGHDGLCIFTGLEDPATVMRNVQAAQAREAAASS